MKHLLLAALAVLVLTSSAGAQVSDHGTLTGLKGVKKIYVDAGNLWKEYDQILDVLSDNAKKIPGVVVVDSPKDAEVILYYGARQSERYGLGPTQNARTPDGTIVSEGWGYRRVVVATGSVVIKETFMGERELLRYDSSKGAPADRPAVQFAKAFVKAWAKANK